MTYSLKYIEDSKGRIKAVQMSAADWKKIKQKLDKADSLTKFNKTLTTAMTEIKLHESGKKTLRGWRDAFKDL